MLCPYCGNNAYRHQISQRMEKLAQRPRPSIRGTPNEGFILNLAKTGWDRDALKVCKSVVSLAISKLGREVYRKFQIQLEAALPSRSQVGRKAPKLISYIEQSLPERLMKIKSFRQ
jgi:hypothetical protein